MLSHGLDLAPFRGVRYVPERVGDIAAVTSPPYDVVVRPDGVDELRTSDPHNVVRLILPQAGDQGSASRDAARTLDRWLAEGVLARDGREALYVYEQRRGATLQRGVIGALRLSPPGDGVVLPHEDVMPQVVAERSALLRETAANLEPLLLGYRGDTAAGDTAADGAAHDAAPPCATGEVIDRVVARPPLLATTTEDGYAHRLWALTDPADLRTVTEDLAGRTALIADGHHRWATSRRVAQERGGEPPWDRTLVLLVDTARHPLQVRPIHRVLPRLSPDRALDAATRWFRTRRLAQGDTGAALTALAAAAGPAFVLTDGAGTHHLLDAPAEDLLHRTLDAGGYPAAWRRLDAAVLHAALLGEVWQVPDLPSHIAYLHDTDAALHQAARHHGTAVLMRPVDEATVLDLARQGVTMPRKSTSFGPKPATGLVLRLLDES
ncbi:DUF1015 family protein [Streptomyces lonarensis]|uniref:DUF1015 domain-containing protein n=1 Tax=Streptomyces lonarensis TaxID=700599 RepID=A0A7X6D559_9ACTN|nr:DUF1015 domain-containing protein [Streptomyces lonarensis]NJQ08372.1 DUF1015 domain-containing protein [Streptomyces lonarensis]